MKVNAVRILFCILPLLVVFSCSNDGVEEKTLATEEYVKLGVPSPDKQWTIEDIYQAYIVLGKMKWEKPYQLPMKDSKKSGALFSHMLSAEHLSFVDNDALSLSKRAELIQSFIKAPSYWGDVYSNPLTEKYYHRERLAIQIFKLNAIDGMVDLGVKILEDPSTVSLRYAVPSIKLDYLACINTTLEAHTEPTKYLAADLDKVSDSVSISLIRNKAWMDSTAIANVRTSLRAVIDKTSSDYVREKYSKLEKSF